MKASAPSGSGRFSLRLCPVPVVPDGARNIRSAGKDAWTHEVSRGIKRKRREARASAHAVALPCAAITPDVFVAGGAGIASVFTLTKYSLVSASVIDAAILLYARIGWCPVCGSERWRGSTSRTGRR